ncbi:MAG: DUF3800 domain-containing protein [Acutalibacteraceae bacterium]|nr:DUF3800 domain-containing protein [Acutalibacteraceae bacterium]
MNRIYAFTDESGAFGWDIDNPNVSTHFIISAIIVEEQNVDILRQEVEKIRQKHFQKGEMKSSSIGKNHKRRKRILADLLPLPFSIFSVVFSKRQLLSVKGLRFKTSFYKFMNNIVHKELRHPFMKLTIVADEIGGSDYMQSFAKYVKNKQDIPTLLGEANFYFENSKNDVLIQLADLISGTLSFDYDEHKKSSDIQSYRKMLEKKITRIEPYPKTYETYIVNNSVLSDEYDLDIAKICFKQAVEFINLHNDDDDEEIQAQLIVLKHLLFRFMNNDLRKYIPTKELKNQLAKTAFANISTQGFRTKIIGKLRDSGVIISSSQKGYKIPAKEEELFDFINHGTTIIIPMLERMKKCRDLIKLGTLNKLDLFDKTEYSSLKKYFDN